MDIKVTIFKEHGKYYTEESVTIPDSANSTPEKPIQVYDIAEWLEKNYKAYKGMHLVAMLDELDYGYPVMIPAERRA